MTYFGSGLRLWKSLEGSTPGKEVKGVTEAFTTQNRKCKELETKGTFKACPYLLTVASCFTSSKFYCLPKQHQEPRTKHSKHEHVWGHLIQTVTRIIGWLQTNKNQEPQKLLFNIWQEVQQWGMVEAQWGLAVRSDIRYLEDSPLSSHSQWRVGFYRICVMRTK